MFSLSLSLSSSSYDGHDDVEAHAFSQNLCTNPASVSQVGPPAAAPVCARYWVGSATKDAGQALFFLTSIHMD